MSVTKKPLALIILDGWGHRTDVTNNAIAAANTPNLDKLAAEYTNTLISGSGLDVGLPDGQMGNSEVGHVNLGAGRVVYQDFTKISKAINDGDFFENAALCGAVDKAVSQGGAVHIMGLLSDGGVHSHQNHIYAAIKLASQRGAKAIYLHCFLDGRDTPPKSADKYLAAAQEVCEANQGAMLATMIGRYYAMDRDNRWERVEQAYNLMVDATAEVSADNLVQALEDSYANDITDEFVKATKAAGYQGLQDNDAVLFMNF
ncbi:MAG: 2,3-bisphosphoglycerate-independent phosphoglycerate mutase, partial [Pseudomonadota bacterium]